MLLWSVTDARNGDSSRWYAPVLFGMVCLLLILAGSTLLVHDHDDQGRHPRGNLTATAADARTLGVDLDRLIESRMQADKAQATARVR
ncbi:MAG: hypothetical protein ACKO32_02440 [Planctomycetia bacterium]